MKGGKRNISITVHHWLDMDRSGGRPCDYCECRIHEGQVCTGLKQWGSPFVFAWFHTHCWTHYVKRTWTGSMIARLLDRWMNPTTWPLW